MIQNFAPRVHKMRFELDGHEKWFLTNLCGGEPPKHFKERKQTYFFFKIRGRLHSFSKVLFMQIFRIYVDYKIFA